MFHRITIEAGRLQNIRTARPEFRRRNRPEHTPQEHKDEADAIPSPPNHHAPTTSFQPDTNPFDALALRKKADDAGRPILNLLRRYRSIISFIVYLLVGTLFYQFHPGNEAQTGKPPPQGVLGFYQAFTIGYSVGLGSKNPDYLPDPWFSSAYILVGAALIAVILTKLGMHMEDSASFTMFEALKRREDYEQKMSRDNPLCTRVNAFILYNAIYLIVILAWLIWVAAIIVWSMIATQDASMKWGFDYAQYFAVSLCSSAGSISLPPGVPDWAYGLAAISMMLGVPLMALAVSSIVIMAWQGHKFKKVKQAAWVPIDKAELDALEQLGLGHKEGEPISKGNYILLGLLRMGQDVGIIKYLADAYDSSEERGGVAFHRLTSDEKSSDQSRNIGYYSTHAHALVASDKFERYSNLVDCPCPGGDDKPMSSNLIVGSGNFVGHSHGGRTVGGGEKWSTNAAKGEGSTREFGSIDSSHLQAIGGKEVSVEITIGLAASK